MSKVQIDILAHADFSGRLRRTKKYPGHAVYATTIENLRRQNPDGTLLLDAGDEFSTTFWGGLPMVKAVSLAGTDAMTLGNHEFDRGEGWQQMCIQAADFPILCANVIRKVDGQLIPGTKPPSSGLLSAEEGRMEWRGQTPDMASPPQPCLPQCASLRSPSGQGFLALWIFPLSRNHSLGV